MIVTHFILIIKNLKLNFGMPTKNQNIFSFEYVNYFKDVIDNFEPCSSLQSAIFHIQVEVVAVTK